MGFFSKVKEMLTGMGEAGAEEATQDYVELDTENENSDIKSQLVVRPFVIEDFEHVKPIIDTLREGRTIALINIKPLRDKDIIELKRAISKLKKTCDAIEGDIAGFGEDWIAAVPSFARIYRGPKKAEEAATEHPTIKDFNAGGDEL